MFVERKPENVHQPTPGAVHAHCSGELKLHDAYRAIALALEQIGTMATPAARD
jgi:hypothetical protein